MRLAALSRMMRWLIALAATFSLTGCVIETIHACTAMAADHGLTLTITGAPEGEINVVVRADVAEAQCLLSTEEQRQPACRTRLGQVSPHGSRQLLITGDSASARLPEVPARVDVSVFDREGRLLHEGTYYPEYTEQYPNGVDCDPEPFRAAQLDVDVR